MVKSQAFNLGNDYRRLIYAALFLFSLASAVHAQAGAVLYLDGSGDYVDAGNDPILNIAENISMMFWAKSTESGEGYMLFKYSTGPGNPGFGLTMGQSTPGTITFWDGTSWSGETTGTINDGRWHHVAVSTNGSSGRIYIDGSLDKSFTFHALPDHSSISLNIGRHSNIGYNSDFGGNLDEVMLYNRTLSGDDIIGSYQRGLGHLPSNSSNLGLIGYWPFDGNVLDYSAYGNNGTLQDDAFVSGFIVGNSSNVSISGISDLKLIIDGSDALSETYLGVKRIEMRDGENLLFNLSHDFSKSFIDFTKVSIEKTLSAIAFNFSDQIRPGDVHSFYVPNNLGDVFYCPSAKTISQANSSCTDAMIFAQAELGSTKYTPDGSYVITSIDGSRVKIFTNSTTDDGGGSGSPVPEFSAITLMLALVIVICGFFIMRNRGNNAA